MLLEIAIADAYGAGFEYVKGPLPGSNDASGYVQHPTHSTVKPGMYTDDAQMSIAVAECLLDKTTTREDFAAAFVRVFKRDWRDGYARGFQAFLEGVADGADFLARIKPKSDKSGGAMRAGPIGLLGSVGAVLDMAARQAALTHDTPGGIAAAQGAALMVFHQVRGLGPISELPDFLAVHAPGIDWRHPHRGRAIQTGEQIARAALGVLLDSKGLKDILVKSVGLGGDTDTVAAIAMAPASVSAELARDIPEILLWTLEGGRYGREHLIEMDRRLAKAFDAPIVAIGPRG